MKKLRKVFALIIAVVVSVLPLSACAGDDGGVTDELQFSTIYAAAVELGFDGTLDELIEAFKGDSAYAIAVSKGYSGSESEWLTSLKGADGVTPSIGTNGNWFIGSTDTGVKAEGEDGKDGADGEDGANGKSAYEIWLDKGNEGSEADFLNWLKGQNGEDGANGKSAYEIWLEKGNEGSEADFLNWLKGQNGEDGANGKSAYEIFLKYNPDYLGDEAQWISDFVAGRLIKFTVTFTAAGSEDIVKSVFYGYDLTDIPEVPQKEGNTGEWDRTDFTNITQDIVVTAVYKTIGLTFELINGGTEYAVTGSNFTSDVSVLIVPSENEGKPITTIGYRAFANNTNLTHVTVPKSVTVIEREAFIGCDSIVEMTVPFVGGSVDDRVNTKFDYFFDGNNTPSSIKTVKVTGGTVIGFNAFASNQSITNISLPDSLEVIGENAFYGCNSLTSVNIPSGVAVIGVYAFRGCASLVNLTLPEGLATIGSGAFNNCVKLTNINIPDSVSYIGSLAFDGCGRIVYERVGNLLYLGNVLFGVTSSTADIYTLKDTTTIIYDNVFSGCANMTSVKIPDSVVYIGNYVFSGCATMTSIKIPDSVVSIGDYTFNECIGLTEVVIPSSATLIGQSAFRGCENITDIVLPNTLTSIGYLAFDKCIALTNVFFKGTKDEWISRGIADGNLSLVNANRYYYSEVQPMEEGNFWYYNENNIPTIWETVA